jgi:hypothetical protein
MPYKNKEGANAYQRRRNKRPEVKAKQSILTRAWYVKNREVHCVNSKINYQFTKEQRAMTARLRIYGLTQETYDALMLKQLGVCALCNMVPEHNKWHVDHDHKTGKVRGLLCKKCNTGLGHFDDEPLLLQAAVEYLNEARKAA